MPCLINEGGTAECRRTTNTANLNEMVRKGPTRSCADLIRFYCLLAS